VVVGIAGFGGEDGDTDIVVGGGGTALTTVATGGCGSGMRALVGVAGVSWDGDSIGGDA
jgi:hypothetical protein